MNKKFFVKVLSMILISIFVVGITKTAHAKIGDSGVIRVEGEETINELLGGVKLHQQDISAPIDCTGDYYYKYDSQYLETMAGGEGVKIVSWSYRNAEKWQMAGVSDIAANFEKENPGWIVVGGTNADFFHINGNGQMASNAMENGEMINPMNITTNSWWRGILGFTKDNELMAGVPDVTDYYTAHIFDENDSDTEKNTIKISAVNPTTISTSGVTVLTKDNLTAYDLRGYKVVIGTYDVVRQTSNGEIFVKGYVKEIRDGKENERPLDFYNDGTNNVSIKEFFLVSKDGSLDDLVVGDYVKVQKDYMNEWANVYNSASYYWKILDNNKVLYEGHSNPEKKAEIIETYGKGGDISYITCTKSRCLFGIKADGSYVMAVIGGSTSSGMTLSEAAYYMKEIGCVDAWDFDGGGSATLIARDEYGNIQTINTPSDGNQGVERRVGNALLMVVRDPGFVFSLADSTPTTVSLKKKTGDIFEKMTNIKLKVDGKTIDVLDEQQEIEITGLHEGEKYLAEISFTYDGNTYQSSIPIQTKEYNERVYFISQSHGFLIKLEQSDEVLEITNIVFDIDGKKYYMDHVEEFTIDNLVKGREYQISYSYTIKNKITNEVYTKDVEVQTYKTLEYEIPSIVTFEQNRKTSNKLSIEYKYEDADKLVKEAYILKNGEKTAVTNKSDIITFENLDFITNKYVFQLVISYVDLDNRTFTVESEELVYEKEECSHEYDNDCDEICNICGETRVVHHSWIDATCDSPKYCSKCHKQEGEALGHNWVDATYDAPKTCSRCGKTEGEPLEKDDHQNEEKGCKKCSKTSVISMILFTFAFSSVLLYFRKKQ